MSENLKAPTVAEQTMADLISSGSLNPAIIACGLSEGRYHYNQGFGAQMRPDQVIHGLVERATMTQLEGGGDLMSLTVGMLAGYRQAARQAGGAQ